ncbi:GAF domain-containing protein [Synechococcus sp. PCC 7336]|uniref:GAF domain-containing protein n=1 Tax=Synechococcus sp. PCC 7336 TaxID=195250 RepID=UPI0006874B44|nr:GAF domain-containing protein [Synechococcus sp. PCC 7336]
MTRFRRVRPWLSSSYRWTDFHLGDWSNWGKWRWLPLVVGTGVATLGVAFALDLYARERDSLATTLQLETDRLARQVDRHWDSLTLALSQTTQISQGLLSPEAADRDLVWRESAALFIDSFESAEAIAKLDREWNLTDLQARGDRDRRELLALIRQARLAAPELRKDPLAAIWQNGWAILHLPIVGKGEMSIGHHVGLLNVRDLLQYEIGPSELNQLVAVTASHGGQTFWMNGANAARNEHPVRQTIELTNLAVMLEVLPQQEFAFQWHRLSLTVGASSIAIGFIAAGVVRLWQNSDRYYRHIAQIARDLEREVSAHQKSRTDLFTSQQRLQAVLENSPTSIFVKDRQLQYLMANKHFANLCGQSPRDLQGKTDRDLFPEAIAAALEDHDRAVLTSGRPQLCEETAWYAGQVRTQLTALTPLGDEAGEIYALCGIATDITDRQQAQLELQNSATQQRLIAAIAERIRNSLDLGTILTTTVTELRDALQVDRVLIYQFDAQMRGTIAYESVQAGWPTTLGDNLVDECLIEQNEIVEGYRLGDRIHAIADIRDGSLDECYVRLLSDYAVRANLVVPILADGHLWGLLAAHQCSGPRQWQPADIELFQRLSTQVGIAIQQGQLYHQARHQAQQHSILNRIVRDMRDSLDLAQVLQDAVELTLEAFQSSRCAVGLCCESDESFTYGFTASTPGISDMKGCVIPIAGNPLAQSVIASDLPIAADHVQQSPLLADLAIAKARELQIESLLVVGIRFEGQLIGIFNLQQCDRPRQWTASEQQLFARIADQLAVAIQQAKLYEQVRQLNQTLEQQVEQRTAQVSKALGYEATLKRITDKVRDSLDETQILQTAAREVANALMADGCNISLYDSQRQKSHIVVEHTVSLSPAQSTEIDMEQSPYRYARLLQRHSCQFCELDPLFNRPPTAILALPIADDRQVLGDMWIFRCKHWTFGGLEIRLAQQVASQCAIAIRQARLYQTARTQVRELNQLNQLKDDFLSTVSHELRSPVANIKMSLHMLEVGIDNCRPLFPEGEQSQEIADKLDRYLSVLEQECDREIELIQDLLDLQRLEAGTEQLEWEEIDLAAWIPHLVMPFVDRAEQRQQTLEIEIDPHLPAIVSDRPSLQRILSELLLNACKYTPPNEQIALTVAAIPQGICMTFTNSGVEIPARDLPHIFEKFYRATDTDRWKQGGTGLGLALVQRVVNSLEGTIAVTSAELKTSFAIELPLRSKRFAETAIQRSTSIAGEVDAQTQNNSKPTTALPSL